MKKRRPGLLVEADDLNVGDYIAVHSLKHSLRALPFFGLASQVKAINLPFVVIAPVSQPGTATIDMRYLNVMRVTEEFAKSQVPTDSPQADLPGVAVEQ